MTGDRRYALLLHAAVIEISEPEPIEPLLVEHRLPRGIAALIVTAGSVALWAGVWASIWAIVLLW
jgi:hypothetical protein